VHATGPSGPHDGAVRRTAERFRALVDGGWALPFPGAGRTRERWAQLAALGADDLSLARLAEGHADALAVLAELGGSAPGHDCRLGVWAAEPPDARVAAGRDGGVWRLHGRKAWCSGARVLTHALVTARAGDGARLFLVALDDGGVGIDPTVWVGPGMAGADTADVQLDGVAGVAVGRAGDYVGRPGFWHGGIGVAAVWAGGTRALARRLADTVQGDATPFLAAAAGAADVGAGAVDAVLRVAADEVDDRPDDGAAAQLRALRVRALAARTAEEVIGISGRALGAAPLAHDAVHAQRVADLSVYVRQHHGERDLAVLGELLGTAGR
jgi:alkylation response protein AidB-like acyl-CoA dehydrogenase